MIVLFLFSFLFCGRKHLVVLAIVCYWVEVGLCDAMSGSVGLMRIVNERRRTILKFCGVKFEVDRLKVLDYLLCLVY